STEPLTPFWQGIHSIRAAMRAQLYEKFTQREAWRRIRHSPGHNLTGASLFFDIDTRARSQFSGDQWADCVSLSPPPQPDIVRLPTKSHIDRAPLSAPRIRTRHLVRKEVAHAQPRLCTASSAMANYGSNGLSQKIRPLIWKSRYSFAQNAAMCTRSR